MVVKMFYLCLYVTNRSSKNIRNWRADSSKALAPALEVQVSDEMNWDEN